MKRLFLLFALLLPLLSMAASSANFSLVGIRIEFILFALVLLGVALFHKQTFWVAIIGFSTILIFKLLFDTSFNMGEHFLGTNSMLDQIMNKHHRQGEWSIVINLIGLLLGFALLAKTFEKSHIPALLPNYLPNDWKGPFMLLIIVAVLSSFLDNIAGALIGCSIALVVFNKKVHIGYIAAIVAASNAGGAGSVLGATTTTMMWIDGVSPLNVFHGYIASIVAIPFFGIFASFQQQRFHPIMKDARRSVKIVWKNLAVVLLILVGAIISNVFYDLPALGVWAAIIIGSFITQMDWKEVTGAIKGTIFLICLVLSASMMPVETLPDASWFTAFILGFVSAVFDNIPLTKLCLEQGHYDWGMLAYTVGFGGSIIWFGSSAGVAVTNKFPDSRDVFKWIKGGWHIAVAYVLGFFALYLIIGWEPASNKKHTEPKSTCTNSDCQKTKDTVNVNRQHLK